MDDHAELRLPFSRADHAVALAAGVLTVLVVGVGAQTLDLMADRRPDVLLVLGGVSALLAVAALQAWHCHLAMTGRAAVGAGWTVSLTAQAFLTYAPFVVFGDAWLALPGFLAGTALLLMPPVWRWVAYASVAVAQIAVAAALDLDPGQLLATVLSVGATGLVLYGVVSLTALVGDLHVRHEQHAQIEVARERARFGRDLHDFLGHRLSLIALKCELAHRLVATDRGAAGAQIAETIDVVRQAQSDLREVARGYARTSLETELASAHSALEAAGAQCRINVSVRTLPCDVSDVLAVVVREGVSNVLRHSAARVCDIELVDLGERVRLTVANDGVLTERRDHEQDGNGIPNLRERTAAVGGHLTAGLEGDGRFRLVAEVARDHGRGH